MGASLPLSARAYLSAVTATLTEVFIPGKSAEATQQGTFVCLLFGDYFVSSPHWNLLSLIVCHASLVLKSHPFGEFSVAAGL